MTDCNHKWGALDRSHREMEPHCAIIYVCTICGVARAGEYEDCTCERDDDEQD